MNKSEVVHAGYDKIAKIYHSQRTIYPNKALLDKISNRLKKGSKVLDLGCGAGVPVSKFLVNNGFQVTGIDFSKNMVSLARENVPAARFKKMDITQLRFEDNSFDAAVSFYALIHVPREKHAKIYRALLRILKPGGIILFNPCGTIAWEGYAEDYLGTRMFWSHYSPRKTLAIIKKAGFEIIWNRILKLGGEKQFWVLAQNKKHPPTLIRHLPTRNKP